MLYFLVNNNFHLIDAEKHLAELTDYKTALIKIPHHLTISSKHSFDMELEFPVLMTRPKDYFNLPRVFKYHRKIKRALKNVKSTDTLIFYTEYEFLTHYFVSSFKKKKAKVLLIEEGVPTYVAYTSKYDFAIPLKNKLLAYFAKYFLGYYYSKRVNINNKVRNIIADSQIDKLLLYTDIKVKRNVSVGLLESKNIEFKQLDDNTVLFLNEHAYSFYMDFSDYLTMIDDILKNLSLKFKKVYFKFHPTEKNEFKKEIRVIISKHSKVSIVEDNQPVELMIEKIGAKYVSSFAAQTLLYLSKSNCIVLYIFHLYPKLMAHSTFIQLKSIIDQMNYIFLDNWAEIGTKTVGFTHSEDSNKYGLRKYLNE